MLGTGSILVVGVGAALASASRARAYPQEMPIRGQILEQVVCVEDSTQSYALYLPSDYTREKPWPVLYALDARGRATVPAERFREAAERYGYIVASSYNSRSDRAMEPDIQAFRNLWRDTHRRFTIDDRRVHVAGFSGEARLACFMADAAPGSVAGVVACGAGFSPVRPPRRGLSFAFFGVVGTTDFNHDEVVGLAPVLDHLDITYRIETFDGGHEWPPSEICAEAVEWMEILAMKDGRRPRDEGLIDALLTKRNEQARAIDASKEPFQAFHRLQSVARDFKGLRDVSGAEKRLAAIGASKAFKEDLEKRGKRARRDADYLKRAAESLARLSADDPESFNRAVSELRITDLKRRAGRSGDREESLSAERLLESVFVQTGYYLPSELLERGDFGRAILSLAIAREIKPDQPLVWYALGRAHARAGHKKDALESLRRAIDVGFADAKRMRDEPDFESLRGEEGFRKLLADLEKKAGQESLRSPSARNRAG